MQAMGRSPAQARMPVRSSIESAGGLHPYNDDDEESQGESRIRAGCWDKHGYLAPEESRRAGNPHSHKSLSMIRDVGWQSPSAAERDKFLKHVCFLSESSAGCPQAKNCVSVAGAFRLMLWFSLFLFPTLPSLRRL